jgi:hypothetical protein
VVPKLESVEGQENPPYPPLEKVLAKQEPNIDFLFDMLSLARLVSR